MSQALAKTTDSLEVALRSATMRPVSRSRILWAVVPMLALGACKKPESPTKEAPADSGTRPALKVEPAPAPEVVPPGPPMREASRAEIEGAIESLSKVVMAGAQDPKNPWAMSHGLLAFGPKLKASDGRLVIDVIVHDYVQLETIANKEVYGFPGQTAENTPVEPHPDLLVKSLVEAGVPLTHKFKLKSGKKVTLQRLVDDAAWSFAMPVSDTEWHKFAWSLTLFLQAYGIEGVVKSQTGDLPVRVLVDRAVNKLELEQAFLLPLKHAGRPDQVEKRKQGIFAHTCGGLHFVQAAIQGAGRSEEKAAIFRANKQMELVDFRWDGERRIYRQMIRTQPKYRFLLLVQELKFHGHILETLAMAQQWGVRPADAATRLLAQRVAADLIDAVKDLKPMYDAQENLKESVPQSYYDLIGDGCHAIRGLRQALVAFFPAPTNP